MVWIQVWADTNEFLRSEKIQSVSYRLQKNGQNDDWIEIVAHPMDKVILGICTNAGKIPSIEQDQKAWQKLVNTRAHLVIEEVIRVISDSDQRAKVVSLKDLVIPDFEYEAPGKLDIEIWVWNIPCQNCHKETPVVYPVGAFFGYMLEFNFLSNLPRLLAEKYPFFKKWSAKGKDGEEYRNTCTHCGEPQPDWRVMESYLDLSNNPEIVKEKSRLTVTLTEEEKAEYKKAGINSSW
ncbi:MAG: hypothetical protein M0Q92_13940 [Methanoregula sp.]|jgi:hypothetical protein|nr:hypothetical protein [Methanoregula sp.]